MTRIPRRQLAQAGLAATTAALVGCPRPEAEYAPPITCKPAPPDDGFDYVVVGSGAGGAPVACGLARAGFRVALIEAGGDPETYNRLVPALHAAAVEDASMRWDFFVRTYDSEEQQRKNPKFVPDEGGVLYPRAGTLGGCTAHNALITIYPHDEDFDAIARMFADTSWSAHSMRRYFERLENCQYAPNSANGNKRSGHGFHGWLPTETTSPWLGLADNDLRAIIDSAVDEASELDPQLVGETLRMALTADRALWDPNDARTVAAAREGMVFVPLHSLRGSRSGTREYVLQVGAACPGNLTLLLDTLACKVTFDGLRANGVLVASGRSLYRASAAPDQRPELGATRVIRAKREVILSGGVFNSPQLLMLSGIGDRAQLEPLGIEVRVDLPGVGKNLQDRYEIGVVSKMAKDFRVLEGSQLRHPEPDRPDVGFEQWREHGTGPYSTNGVLAALIKKSAPERALPDLFLFGLVGRFQGYYPGFSRDLVADHRHFTWGVLKAHTENRAGEVRLASPDPRDRPLIHFHYFEEGEQADLEAVVDGVLTVRRIMARLGDRVAEEVAPGPLVRTRAEIAQYVRDHTWGHHASCSNKMGPKNDPWAVVDQRFRVHGTQGLRVVDASVFPRIPGFFIVTSVMMIGEKAVDVLIEDARIHTSADSGPP